jgi:hypothetical protein
VQDVVLKVPAGGWRIGDLTLSESDVASATAQDWDGDGTVESAAEELDGLAAAGTEVVMTYDADPSFRIDSVEPA